MTGNLSVSPTFVVPRATSAPISARRAWPTMRPGCRCLHARRRPEPGAIPVRAVLRGADRVRRQRAARYRQDQGQRHRFRAAVGRLGRDARQPHDVTQWADPSRPRAQSGRYRPNAATHARGCLYQADHDHRAGHAGSRERHRDRGGRPSRRIPRLRHHAQGRLFLRQRRIDFPGGIATLPTFEDPALVPGPSGPTVIVSADVAGNEGNKDSGFVGNDIDISGDGRFVVFGSNATNLVPDDTNGY